MQKIALPLVASPLVALAIVSVLIRASRRSVADCACVTIEPVAEAAALARGEGHPVLTSALLQVRLTVATSAECAASVPQAAGLRLEYLHWLTSGAASFARALNDAPKIVALLLVASALAGAMQPVETLFGVVALGMVAGSIVGGRRVTALLAQKVTRMDHREGFLANATTTALVGAGAVFGLPMSTTHVASSAIVGAGAERGMARLNRRTLRDLVLAWMVTVPLAAALGVLGFALLGLLRV